MDLLTFVVRLLELFEKATILCTLTALPKAPEDAPKLGMFAASVDIYVTYCYQSLYTSYPLGQCIVNQATSSVRPNILA